MMPLYAELENCDMVAVGERVHYLSLAMDARRALNAIRAADKGAEGADELRASIRAATESLEILLSGADLYANLSPEHYVQYEEIQTLREVSSSFEAGSLIQSLRSLLASGSERPSVEEIGSARKFFRALESRALHHYNDPASSDAFTV
jgi:hypothetical protein